MNSKIHKSLFAFFSVTLLLFVFVANQTELTLYQSKKLNLNVKSTGSAKAGIESKKARFEYFFNMLRDPKTNAIPKGIHSREMEYAQKLRANSLKKAQDFVEWKEAGPNDVGGRTRALAIDSQNSQIILAGGVSGGIWKSTDGGATWELKNDPTQVKSVSDIVQDPNNPDTWYYSSGEVTGNSASEGGAFFFGDGIYKSIDNGENWSLLPKGLDNIALIDNPLNLVSNIEINPSTGSIFISSNGYGIYKSTDGGNNFNPVKQSVSYFSEVEINTNGHIVATLSEFRLFDSGTLESGVFLSTDDGSTWTDITPANYPVGEEYQRAVIAYAPSNPNIFYVFVDVETEPSNIPGQGVYDVRLFKINLGNNSSIELTDNLPDFRNMAGESRGALNTQGNYNMVLGVKPDDENFVLLGATNLYRSTDGFSTPADNAGENWIGGYSGHENLHVDIHAIIFDENNPNNCWIGTDGGLSFASDITSNEFANFLPYESKNNSYNVTQFYHISIPWVANDTRYMGGTQDNGSPYFRFDGTTTYNSTDISGGDGSFSYFASTFAYVSSQLGRTFRVGYVAGGGMPYSISGTIFNGDPWTELTPEGSEGHLFINPFILDHNNDNTMYYIAGSDFWRNSRIKSMNNNVIGSTSQNWTKLNNLTLPDEYVYTAVNVSRSNPEHILYLGASDTRNISPRKPIIYKMENSRTDNDKIDVSSSSFPDGTNVQHIAINPEDANEIIVSLSNYSIIGLYHSTNGGQTYTAIEGNLEGDNNNGPSIRCAAIHPTDNGNIYFVGTSFGVFSTNNLNGMNTNWELEADDIIGNTVVTWIETRTLDDAIFVGTHGRGIFSGTINAVTDVDKLKGIPLQYELAQNFPNPFNPSTKIKYSLPNSGRVQLTIYNSVGERIADLINTNQTAGSYEVEWNGRNFSGQSVASGVYFYTLTSDNFVQTKKMILLR